MPGGHSNNSSPAASLERCVLYIETVSISMTFVNRHISVRQIRMTMLNRIFYLISIFTLTSCGGTTHSLTSGNFSNNDNYKINSYFGCCGCQAKYFTINSRKRKVEQIIYSYNCYSIGKPTKFIFNYNDNGQLISCDKYVATNSNDYIQKLTEQERQLFSAIDTISSIKATHINIKFSEITGFRKPQEKEVTHSFPLIKKGYKLQIN